MDTYMDYSSDGEYWDGDDSYSTPDSVLLSLVQSYEWAGVKDRIISHPDECKAVGVQGRTPLHVACDHDAPALIIQDLLLAYPEASLMVGTSNMNPLHITCSSQHASVQVVQYLLEGGHPTQTSMRDLDGDTPLHAACRCGAPYDVIKLLLLANPSVVDDRDYELLTPLLRLWVRYVVILGDDVIDNVKGSTDLKGELGTAWRNTELLLRCAHLGSLGTSSIGDDESSSCSGGGGTDTTSSLGTSFSSSSSSTKVLKSDLPSHYQFRTLHAAAAVDCPRSVVKIASIVHPQQLVEQDEMGMTPLLIAAAAPIFKVRDLSDQGYLLEDQIHGDGEDLDGSESCNDDENDSDLKPSVIEILVKASPNSAAIPSGDKRRLPLHVAVASGKRWNEGVQTILNVYPEALCQLDTETGLYPFLLSATIERPDLSTILDLLRKDPSLITPTQQRGGGDQNRSPRSAMTDHIRNNGMYSTNHGMMMMTDERACQQQKQQQSQYEQQYHHPHHYGVSLIGDEQPSSNDAMMMMQS